jgi:hypothetical protein
LDFSQGDRKLPPAQHLLGRLAQLVLHVNGRSSNKGVNSGIFRLRMASQALSISSVSALASAAIVVFLTFSAIKDTD